MKISVKSMKQCSFPFWKIMNLVALTFLFLIVILSSQSAYAIKKCKDANGKWHYGDIAVRECEDSKVTTLSKKGTITDQKAAPKTAEQLAEEEATRVEREAVAQREKAEEREKTRILSVYETEGDIDRQRDNQLYSVDSNIAVHNTYLESLQELISHEKKKNTSKSKKKIKTAEKNHKTYSAEVIALKAQREEIIEKFAKEKLVYRDLKKSNEEGQIESPKPLIEKE